MPAEPIRTGLSAESLRRLSGLAEVRVYPRLGSTNTQAERLVEAAELALPAAVLAARQTAGRGRGANTWYSDAGSLTVTFVLRAMPEIPSSELPLRVGLAARRAIAEWLPDGRLTVKWPNDLLADGRKLGGILCRRVRGAELIGIGINVSTDLSAAAEAVRRRAAAMAQFAELAPDRADVFLAVWRCLSAELAGAGPDWRTEINRVHALAGRVVAVDTGRGVVRGRCAGIDPAGRLLLESDGATLAVADGTVVSAGE